jgi:hypothetical protein
MINVTDGTKIREKMTRRKVREGCGFCMYEMVEKR